MGNWEKEYEMEGGGTEFVVASCVVRREDRKPMGSSTHYGLSSIADFTIRYRPLTTAHSPFLPMRIGSAP